LKGCFEILKGQTQKLRGRKTKSPTPNQIVIIHKNQDDSSITIKDDVWSPNDLASVT